MWTRGLLERHLIGRSLRQSFGKCTFQPSQSSHLKRRFGASIFQRKKSHYEILEVDSNADAKAIKKAFMKKGRSM
jgi:hypothetical protein